MAAGEAADQQRRAVTTGRLAFQFATDRCEQRHRPAPHRTASAGQVKRGLPWVRERGGEQRKRDAGDLAASRLRLWMAEEEALSECRAERSRVLNLLLRLDAFGHHRRTGALGLSADRPRDRGDLRRRLLLDQAQVELDDVGPQDGHQRERARVRADIVERDAPAVRARTLNRRQQLRKPVGQGPLRELDHAPHPAPKLRKGTEAGLIRLGIHEQRQRRLDGIGPRAGDRRTLTRRVKLRQTPFGPGRCEELIGAFEASALGSACQSLESEHEHDACLQVDDRLVHRTETYVAEKLAKIARRAPPLANP
jgi:hypothetical protein